MTTEIEKTNGAMTATKGFSEQSIETTGSTMESVLAAREKAMIESRLIMAMNRPRDWDDIRVKLMNAVERPGFADADIEDRAKGKRKQPGSAWYKLPGYDNAEGFSIRFAEECIRAMGHLDAQSQVFWEDDKKRIVTVNVFDLENNVSIPTQITLEKTMERKSVKKGQIAIGTRVNSSGKTNFILPADEAEMTKKQNSAVSKAIRNAVLRLVPGDIQAACRQRIMEIRHGDTAKDPDGARRKMIDAFATLNVSPLDLVEYAGFDLDKLSPAQIDAMRKLYDAIKKGETSWQDVITEVRAEREPDGDTEKKTSGPVTLDTVTEANKEANRDASWGEITPAMQTAIGMAEKIFPEETYMNNLSALCREKGFSFTAARQEQLDWLVTELSDRLGAIESEVE